MRKIIVFLLVFLLLCGCSANVPPLATAESPKTATAEPAVAPPAPPPAPEPPPAQAQNSPAQSTPNTPIINYPTPIIAPAAPPAPEPPDQPAARPSFVYIPKANYIFIGGSFIGCYADGRWTSAASTQFSIAGLLEQDRYYCFNETNFVQAAEKVELYWDDSGDLPGSFLYKENGALLVPYAVEYKAPVDTPDNDFERTHCMWFDLPCKLPEELRYITIKAYNSPFDFPTEMDLESWYSRHLVMSSDHNPYPRPISKIEEPSKEDIAAVAAELARLGIPGGVPNITEAYELDIDGDGSPDRVIFANSKLLREEDSTEFFVTEEEIENRDSGVYYLALVRDESGCQTLISECEPYLYDDQFLDSLNKVASGGYASRRGGYFVGTAAYYGAYDLNNDGVYEIGVDIIYLDNDDSFIFALSSGGKWENVLNGFSGLP